jgi:hypothetical protein
MLYRVDQAGPDGDRLFRGVYRAASRDLVLAYVACRHGSDGLAVHEIEEVVEVDEVAVARQMGEQRRRREQRVEAVKRRRAVELAEQLARAEQEVERLRAECAAAPPYTWADCIEARGVGLSAAPAMRARRPPSAAPVFRPAAECVPDSYAS